MNGMSKKITCRQAVDLISKKEESKLSAIQRFLLYKHLGECSLCRIFSVQNKIIAKAIQYNNSEDLSVIEKESIIQRVMKSGS
jgi:predicted anti-sigma-YlaC factor YlaD